MPRCHGATLVGPSMSFYPKMAASLATVRAARNLALVTVIALLAGCGAGGDAGTGSSSRAFDAARAFRALEAQVRLGPRPAGSPEARREVAFIASRLRTAGIAHVVVQRPHRNVVARIPGRQPGTVVVGAHYDTKRIPGPALYARFARAARAAGQSAPFQGKSPGVIDDHAPFIRAGVPAVDLIDFDYGPGPAPGAWWHTRQDDLRHVCARSLGAVGEPALAALPGIR